MKYLLACSKLWNKNILKDLETKTGQSFELITKKEELSVENLAKINPQKIFFPHWSYIIPKEIFENYECVIFHMTDLPFGRGGSPLQNLIVRGYEKTKISAFRCSSGMDTGPIYLKKDLELNGSAQQIFSRAAVIIESMITEIIKSNPQSVPQSGDPVEFKRRKPEDSALPVDANQKQIYDFIRMLDAEGYPAAFLKLGNLRIEFTDAINDSEHVEAKVKIYVQK